MKIEEKGGSQHLPSGYKHTEIGLLPEDWNVKALGQLGQLKNGINKSKQAFGHGFPFVNLMDVFGIPKLSTNTGSLGLVNSLLAERKLYDLRGGDVLFVRSSVKPEGVGLTTLIPERLAETVFSGFLIRYRDNGELEPAFREHCFWEEKFRKRVIAASTVSANTNINQSALKHLLVGFPLRLGEQRAIAESLSDVDGLLAALEALIIKKRAIKQATMQQLLTGRTRLPCFHGEWVEKRLGDAIDILADYTANGSFEALKNNVTYYETRNYAALVRTTDLDKAEFVPERFTDERGYKFLSKTSLFGGEIIVANVGSIGKVFRVPFFAMPMTLAPNTYLLKFDEKTDEDFIYQWLKTAEFYSKLMSKIGSTTLQAVNKDNLRSIELCIPSEISEQTAIAAILSDMDAEIAALETRRKKTHAIKKGMMQQLLTGRIRLVKPQQAEAEV